MMKRSSKGQCFYVGLVKKVIFYFITACGSSKKAGLRVVSTDAADTSAKRIYETWNEIVNNAPDEVEQSNFGEETEV